MEIQWLHRLACATVYLCSTKMCNVCRCQYYKKISLLAEHGVTICGAKPTIPASLTDSQEEFDRLASKIWGGQYANVTTGIPAASIAQQMGLQPDFAYAGKGYLRYVHRQNGSNDIYWVNNMEKESVSAQLKFRVTGRRPRLWNPETGTIEEVSYSIGKHETTVSLRLSPEDAVFIVFDEPSTIQGQTLPEPQEQLLDDISTDWSLNFQKHRGAPATAHLDSLYSLSESKVEGIKYFSGTTIYKKNIQMKSKQLSGKIVIDLGTVGHIAEVFVNGEKCGTL